MIMTAPCGCMPGHQLCQVAEYLWARHSAAYHARLHEEEAEWRRKYDEHMDEVQEKLAAMAREGEVDR